MDIIISLIGDFALSEAANEWLEKRGFVPRAWTQSQLRTHPLVVKCVWALGNKAGNGLVVVSIPDGSFWTVEKWDDGGEKILFSSAPIEALAHEEGEEEILARFEDEDELGY